MFACLTVRVHTCAGCNKYLFKLEIVSRKMEEKALDVVAWFT